MSPVLRLCCLVSRPMFPVLKGLSHEMDFNNVEENWQMLALLSAAAGFLIFQRPLWFLIEIKHLLSGKCWYHADSCSYPINFVSELPASLPYHWRLECCFMSNQSEEGFILCMPIGAKLWPSTSSRPIISTSANTTWRTAGTVWSVQNLHQLSWYQWYQYYADSE